jgi:hypothetical protein
MAERLLRCSAAARGRLGLILAVFALLFVFSNSSYAQLNFNNGNFGTVLYGDTAFALTPTGGTAPYTFSSAPGANVIPNFRVENRPNVPNFFNANATGALIGLAMPGMCAPSGTCSTTIRLTDATNAFVDHPVTFSVVNVDIGGGPFSGYGVGDTVDFRFWGVGGSSPYTFTQSSGTLPPGLTIQTMSGAFTGISIGGTLTTAGNYGFGLKITDALNNSTIRNYSVSVSPLRLVQNRALPAATVNLFYSEQLTVSGCNGTCTFSINQGDAVPPGLSLSSSGLISGTPTVGGSYFNNFTVVITDGTNTINPRMQLAVLPVTPVPLSINTPSIPDTPAGSTPAWAIYPQGGVPPYTVSLDASSSLPAGAFILPSSTVGPGFDPQPGYLWSKVLVPGLYNFLVRVTDSANNTATRPMSFRVVTMGTWYQGNALPISPNPAAVFGVPLTPQPLLIVGGTPPYSVSPINLIAGLSVDNEALVTGTPQEIGRFMPLTLAIRDSANPQNTFMHTGSIIVSGPSATSLAVTGGNFGPFQTGAQNNILVFASGSPLNPPNFTVSIVGGSLPPGMTLLTGNDFSNAGDITRAAQIAGIPTTPGLFSVLLRVVDGAGNVGQRQLNISVSDLGFVTSGLASGTVGQPYNQTFDVRGGKTPYTFALTTGSLPTGLQLVGSTITGTPTTSNSTTVGIQVTDANGDQTTRFFVLNIFDIQITTPNILPTAFFGEPYTPLTFAAQPAGNYTWTVTGLPGGLTLNSGTGVLSGTPATTGSFTVTVTAGTGNDAVTKTFTLFVTGRFTAGVLTGLPTASLGDFVVGSTVNITLNVAGGTPPYTIGLVSGSSLPPGLALVSTDSVTGTTGFGRTSLAGVPTTIGPYSFKLQYADSVGVTAQRTVTMGITSIGLSTVSPGIGHVNVPYSAQLHGEGGSGSYTFALANILNNVMPPGLTLSSSGLISGTPTSTGTFFPTIDLSDGVVTHRQFILLTIDATGLSRIDFSIGPIFADSSMGRFTGTLLTPTGGGGTHTWSVSGSLPPGMFFLAGATLPPGFTPPSAIFAGVPTTAGTYTFTIRVDDSTGNFGIRNVTMKVTPLRFGPATVPHTLGLTPPPIQDGVPYSFGLTAFNNAGPVNFTSLAGAFMPTGIAMNSSGVVSGTTSDGGNFVQPYLMTDSMTSATDQNNGQGFLVYPSGKPIGVNGLTSVSLATATQGIAYSKNLNDFLFPGYGTGPFNWALFSGSLPAGMSILGNVLTGTPTTVGTSFFSLIVTDANLTQYIIPNISLGVGTMSIAPGSGILPPAISGVPYTQTFTAAGGVPPIKFSLGLVSDLPVGLSLSTSGVLSGTPTTAGPFIILIDAVDNTGATFEQRYTLNVAPVGTVLPALTATPSSIDLTYVQGNPNPSPVLVGIGTTSTPLSYTATAQSSGGNWLSVAPAGGSTPSSVTLTFNTTGLATGVFNGTLNLTAASAVNSPLSVPVKLTVTAPVPCSYSIDSTSSSIAAYGGPTSFNVTTDPTCDWAASTTTPWLTINSGNGTGTGTVNLTIQTNTGTTTRTGAVTIQGLTYTVTQFGTGCSFTLTPNSISVDSFGGPGAISIQASSSNCAWNIQQGDAWISASPTSGQGSAPVNVTVGTLSSTSSRTGSITIAGQTLTVNQAGQGCYFFLDNSGASFSSTGGTAQVTLNTLGGCAWKTDPGPSWITATAGQSGIATGIVRLSIAANSSVAARSASVLIGDQTYQVTQDGVPCSFSVGVDNTLFSSAGGSGNVTITAAGGACPWVASSTAAWLTMPLSGSGTATVAFNVTANPGTTARSATLNVAGQNIVINESGPTCNYTLRSALATIPSSGGSSSASVITASGCSWAAVSNAPWLTITSGASSSGSADVLFNAQPNNTGTTQTGTLTIAGQTFTVNEAPAPCTITLGSNSLNVGAFGGAGSFSYTTSVSGCNPTVLSYTSMITVTSATYSGTTGTVNFTVDANGYAATRSGIIKVNDASFTVTQDASPCAYMLTATSATFGRLGGNGSVPMTFAPSSCGPPAVLPNDPASMVTLGPVLKDLNTYNQNYSVGIYQSFINYIRTAQLLINGQIFTVKQTSW